MNLRSLLLTCLLLGCQGSSVFADVLIIAADFTNWTAEVRQSLTNSGFISGNIDTFDARVGTPSLGSLQAYDAVLVYSNYQFANRTTLGNVLANYVDQGGGVVEAPFASNNGVYGLRGRWTTQQYGVWGQGPVRTGNSLTLGTVYDPGHAIMAGVNSFDGGSNSWHSQVGPLTPDSELIADWSNGRGLVAVNTARAGRVVGLNFFPPSDQSRVDFWDSSTDGLRLLANALNFAGSANSVPEPGSLLVLSTLSGVLVGWGCLRRRRERSRNGPAEV